jgi:hypothetical protein
MAFPAAPGYGNLPNGNFSPTIFSQKALKAFRKVSVVEDITNTDYFGEIANYGDSVRIIKEPDVTVVSYARGQQLIPQDLLDDELSMTVDQANAFSFLVDDIEQKHSHVNFETLASNRAAYKLKDTFDSHILNHMAVNAGIVSGLGTTSAAIEVRTGATGATEFTPLSIMNRVSRLMDQANIPEDGRFWVADPIFWEQMGDENSKLINRDFVADGDMLRNGRVTANRIRNFTCYKSNNLPVGGTGSAATSGGTNYGTIVVGHMSSTATVSQIAKTETIRSPDTFADVVRGLHLFGRKVIRPEALATVRWQVGS